MRSSNSPSGVSFQVSFSVFVCNGVSWIDCKYSGIMCFYPLLAQLYQLEKTIGCCRA